MSATIAIRISLLLACSRLGSSYLLAESSGDHANRGHFLAYDGNFITDSLLEERTDINRTRPVTANCMESFTTHPEDAYCPAGCPYLRREPTGFCDFKCVQASQCNDDDPMASFADPETMRCTSCHVPACHRCGTSHKSCAVCHEGFELLPGSTFSPFSLQYYKHMISPDPSVEAIYVCKGKNRFIWRGLFAVTGITVVFLAVYIVTLARRNVSNELALRHALRCRASATLHTYPLMTDLCHKYVSGVGVMLHFRFQMYAIIAAIVVFVILFITAQSFEHTPLAGKKSPRSFSACDVDISEQKRMLHDMEEKYLVANVIIYILGTLCCFFVATRQQRYAIWTSESNTTMQDYAIYVKGLPSVPGSVKAEEIMKKEFQKAFGDKGKVVGVSICWDYRHCPDTVEDQVAWELSQLDAKRDQEADDAHAEARRAANLTSARQAQGKFFYKLDDVLFGIKEYTPAERLALDAQEAQERSAPKVKELLSQVSSTEAAYIVMGSEKQRDDCIDLLQEKGFDMAALHQALGVEGQQVTELVAKSQDCEPGVIMWQNHGVDKRSVALKLVASAFALVIAIAILDIIFYFPSVNWLLTHADIQGHRQGGVPLTVLGLLVVVCNQAIYAIIDQLADFIGFKNNDTRQRFYVVWYTAAVFINTILDLGVVVLTAQGFSMDKIESMDVDADVTMSARALADNPAVQNALYYQFVIYTWPSCLLVPFLIEPVLQLVLFCLMSWLVRSRNEIGADQAESFLMWAPFDLAHYGDILVNNMLCATTLLFNQRNLWFIWAALVASLLYICAWDHCRFLRFSRRSIFVSSNLDYTVQKLMAVPCAIMACCVTFRLFQQDVKGGKLFGLDIDFYMEAVKSFFFEMGLKETWLPWVPMAIVATLHICFHMIVLHYIIPWFAHIHVDHDRDIPYSETAKQLPRNWFNANPIHTLRSKYFYEHERPVVMFRSGKEYLQQPNAELGQYFECEPPPVDDESLRDMMRHAMRDAEEGAKAAAHRMSTQIETLQRVVTAQSEGILSPRSAQPGSRSRSKLESDDPAALKQ